MLSNEKREGRWQRWTVRRRRKRRVRTRRKKVMMLPLLLYCSGKNRCKD